MGVDTEMAAFEIRDTCAQENFQAFMKTLGPETLRNFDHFDWDNSYKTFYVYEDKKIIAYGFLRSSPHRFKQHLCVLGMVVADSHQGKGVGTYLGKEMIYWAQKMMYSKIALGVYADNINAMRFYEKLGFVTEGILHKEELRKGEFRDLITMAMYL